MMRHDGDGGRPRPKRSRKRGGPTSGAGHRRSKSHGAKNDLATGSLLAGRHAVLALLEHQPQRGVHLYMQKGARGLDAHRQAAMKAHIPISELDKEALTQRYGGEPNHQGVLLKAGAYVYLDEEEMFDGSPSLWVALDGVEDPRNLGAAARAALAFGVEGLMVPARRAAAVTPAAEKVAVGALAHLPTAQVTNLHRALERAKESGLWIIGAEMDGPQLPWEVDLKVPICLVIGGEDSGLRRLTREACDAVVRLPTRPGTLSLNAADALTVLLYEVARQRAATDSSD